jgi:hypothetical protein
MESVFDGKLYVAVDFSNYSLQLQPHTPKPKSRKKNKQNKTLYSSQASLFFFTQESQRTEKNRVVRARRKKFERWEFVKEWNSIEGRKYWCEL